MRGGWKSFAFVALTPLTTTYLNTIPKLECKSSEIGNFLVSISSPS